MATVIHFDISADNLERAKIFYQKLFGWKIEKFTESPQDYYLIETQTATGEKGITGENRIKGEGLQKITNFIQVDSIDESIEKVKELGGQIIEPKTTIPTVGYIAGCKDTENNIFGLIEVENK